MSTQLRHRSPDTPPRRDGSASAAVPPLARDSHLVEVEGVPLLVNPVSGNWLRLSPRGGDWVRALADGDLPPDLPGSGELLHQLSRGGFLAPARGNGNGHGPDRAATAVDGAHPLGSVVLNLTHRCNLRCRHCAVFSETPKGRPTVHLATPRGEGAAGNGAAKAAEPSTEGLLELVDRLADAGTRRLIFFGGEPLLRRDFATLLEHAAERMPSLGLTTNGTLLTPEMARLLGRHRVEIRLSLDGSCPEVNDAIRGRGSFEQARRGLEVLAREGHRDTTVKCVITRTNQHDVPNLVKLARRYGTALELSFFVAVGRGEGTRDHFTPTVAGVVEALQRVWLLADYYGVPSATFNAFCRRFMARAGTSCGPGFHYSLVDWSGEVFPCESLQTEGQRMGRLGDGDADPLRPPAPEAVSVEASDHCSRCAVRFFCRGGCAAETLTGSSAPSVCPVYRRLLPPIVARWDPQRGNWHNQRAVFGDDGVALDLIRPYLT